MTDPIPGYRLGERLGEGAMGEVFAAEHLASGREVAIKRVRDGHDAALETEILALAALDHPNVVEVLDAGRDERGRPWLAMERIHGAPLDRRPDAGWPEVRDALRQTLAALAHAHARGLLHRDVKPENLLWERATGRIVVTDLGLSVSTEATPGRRTRSGTLATMAPEQLTGRWQDFGPATDLYAVGATAWLSCTGAPPFPGLDPRDAMRHRHAGPSLFQPRFPVPAGLESLLLLLLRPDPEQRPDRAADVAAALDALGDVGEVAPIGFATGRSPTTSSGAGETWTDEAPLADAPAPAADRVVAVLPRAPRSRLPPPSAVRGRWDAPGRALLALRRPPLIGRETPWAEMWDALDGVERTGAPAAIRLSGPEGVGKTALARAFVEAVHEAGAATPLEAHDGKALRAGLGRWLGVRGRVGPALEARLVRRLGGDPSLDPIATWLSLQGEPPRDAVERVLAMLAAERPVVLWLDDADPGGPTDRLAEAVLAGEAPVLVLLTRSDTASPGAAERWARELPLSPLSDAEADALIDALADLERHEARALRERAGGLPRRVVDLLTAQIGGARVDDPREAWARRLADAGLPAPTVDLLRLLALGGDRAPMETWAAAAAAAGLPDPAPSVPALVRGGLATVGDGEVRLAHPLLRDALTGSDTEGSTRAHAAWAAVLEDPAARAPHRRAVGDLTGAEADHAAAHRHALREGSHGLAMIQAIALWQYARERRLGPADPEWLIRAAQLGRVLAIQRDLGQLLALAEEVGERGRIEDHAGARGLGRHLAADAYRRLHRLEEAEAQMRAAFLEVPAAPAPGRPRGIWEHTLGRILWARHQLDAAETWLTTALGELREAGNAADTIAVWGELGWIARARSDDATAETCWRAALSEPGPEAQTRRTRHAARIALAELARRAGRPAEARAALEAVLADASLFGVSEVAMTRLNLAAVLLAEGRTDEAGRLAARSRRALRGLPAQEGSAWLLEATARARLGDLPAAREGLTRGLALVPETWHDHDVVDTFRELAGSLALAAPAEAAEAARRADASLAALRAAALS